MNNSNNTLTPAFINEKDVCSDFVYDMFDDGFLETIKSGRYHLIGYYNDRLLEVTWNRKSNRMCFAFVDLQENHHRDEDKKKLIDFIKNVQTESAGLIVKVFQSGNWIISDYYFQED